NKQIVIKQNPYYKGKRPHNVSQIVFTIGNTLEASYLRAQQGATDYPDSGIPASSYAEVANKYKVNKAGGQFFVKPIMSISYLAFNHDRALFKGNVPLMKAINYALDRKAVLQQGGYLAGKRT